MRRPSFIFASCLSAALLTMSAGCGHKAVPSPAPITTSAKSLSFSSGTAQTFTVSEPGYNGSFTAQSSNSNVATVTAVTGQSSSVQSSRRTQSSQATGTTFTVTPVGGGTATITVSNTIGFNATISVTVTGATFTPQLQR